ncbi:MAG: sugar transporter permease [Paenibacillaceae bacterium]|jgi:putative aldouronate transport system permease protein|nr:sugar transporter permease [Paenibacillaceae bacterium]
MILLRKHYMLYLFVLPAVIYVALFEYLPLYGVQIAFKDFSASTGIWGSPWVGLKHFQSFFESYYFWQILLNTLRISFLTILAGFVFPLILAFLINYATFKFLGKFAQTVTYMPHFISNVVMVGVILLFLMPDTGVLNRLIELAGGTSVPFMGQPKLFTQVYVWSDVWQNTGWNSIIYLAALTGIDPSLHESAVVDGASKLQRLWHVDLPGIAPTIVVVLILNVGQVMNLGFEKIYLMQNSINLEVSEVISTYVYKRGLLEASYDFSTAVGLFNNILNFITLISVNFMARKINGNSLW